MSRFNSVGRFVVFLFSSAVIIAVIDAPAIIAGDRLQKFKIHRFIQKNYADYLTADFNGDGNSDLLCLPQDISRNPELYYNYSADGLIDYQIDTIAFAGIHLLPDYPFDDYGCQYEFFDADHDADLDIVIANTYRNSDFPVLRVYLNSGTAQAPLFSDQSYSDSLLGELRSQNYKIIDLGVISLPNLPGQQLLVLSQSSDIDLFYWQKSDSGWGLKAKYGYIPLGDYRPYNKNYLSSIQADNDTLPDLIISAAHVWSMPDLGEGGYILNRFWRADSLSDSVACYHHVDPPDDDFYGRAAVVRRKNQMKDDVILQDEGYYSGYNYLVANYFATTDTNFHYKHTRVLTNQANLSSFDIIRKGSRKNDLLLSYYDYPAFEYLKLTDPVNYSYEQVDDPDLPKEHSSKTEYSIQSVDFNNDLLPDLLIGEHYVDHWVNMEPPPQPKMDVYILWNTGSDSAWTWREYTQIFGSDTLYAIEPFAVDLDEDHDKDLFVSFKTKKLTPNQGYVEKRYYGYMLNTGSETAPNFDDTLRSVTGLSGGRPSFADLNNDGKDDLILVAGRNVRIYKTISLLPILVFQYDETASAKINAHGIDTYFCRPVDFDGDGKQDLILGPNANNLFIYSSDTLVALEEFGNNRSFDFILYQNYPNPFNSVTRMRFQVHETGFYRLTVYNLLGQRVAQPVAKRLVKGNYLLDFNAEELASGVYIYELKSGHISARKKFVLVR